MAVIVPIQTEFDASGVNAATSKFAKFSQTVSKSLQQAGKDARKSFAEVEQGANTSSTAAQRLAASITKTANTLDSELKASTAAADALGLALGPEFAAKIGRNGLNKLVTDLNRAGVSVKDITAEADVLAAAIKQVDDVNLRNVSAEADHLQTSIDGVTKSTDRSRSVMANFTGNAAQEIPGVANALGPLNVAIGQFAEYAAEGGISLKGLATAIAPIAAITVAIALLKSRLADIAQTKAFNKADVDAYTKALKDGASATEAFKQRLVEVGAVQTRVFDANAFAGLSGIAKSLQPLANSIPLVTKFLGLFSRDKTLDLTETFIGLGLGVSEVSALVAGGIPAITKFAAAQRKAGNDSEGLQQVVDLLSQKVVQLGTSEKAAATSALFFIDTSRQSTSSTQALASAAGFAAVGIAQQTAATEAATAASEAAAQADRDQANAIDSVRNALYARNNARYAATDADISARTAIDEYNKAQKKADKSGKPKDIAAAADAQRQAERAINGAAAAASSYAEETNKGASATQTAAAASRAAVVELNKLKDTVSKDGALTFAVEQWIFLLNSVPKTIDTAFGISFGSSVKPVRQTTGIPDLDPSAFARTGNNGVSNVTNITVNGAIDPTSTARQVRDVLNKDSQRRGTGTILS
ncbi:hypothetical protein UFOVP1266_10 [uncultured Caudovirales phage]|uniref:Uncharacterized protein n=1 Tax=uncultured Caudovirales phage TaxID=2100421 RepID=A0A6J5P970_9CAUD|nr:hypothetical protein UFOVP876_10 [uncultured Caudovirales phage]CAB4194913.1 hypothetical protein UFOVP1266_10 [uncultured Caudovirales phage]